MQHGYSSFHFINLIVHSVSGRIYINVYIFLYDIYILLFLSDSVPFPDEIVMFMGFIIPTKGKLI